MKKPIICIVATSVFAAVSENSNAMTIKVSDLPSIGIDQNVVIEQFSSQFNLQLELSDLIEVQKENEGTSLRMEAADHMAVLVPILNARSPVNKDID